MKSILILLLFGLNVQVLNAQFLWAELGVDGLTCSQCSRSVEMSLLKLDFVKSVEMNLENTNGKIVLQKNTKIDLIRIAKAVTDAGFSMRYLKVTYLLPDDSNLTGSIQGSDSRNYCVVNAKGKALRGEVQFTVVSKKFMPRKEYDRWRSEIIKNCGGINKDEIYLAL